MSLRNKMEEKYVGFITRHRVLHLYEDPDDLRKDLFEWRQDRDFSMIAWIDKTIVHNKTEE